jgi:hypothetical protein
MSFAIKFTLAAGVISLVGLFFLVLGLRQLARSRAKLPWRTVIREGFLEMTGQRPATGKGGGLYFCLFGAFMIAICLAGAAVLLLMRLLFSQGR